MKKIRFSLIAMMMALVCVGFSSCSSDDDEPYNVTDEEAVTLLQGTWNVKVTDTDDEGSDINEEVWKVEGNRLKINSRQWGNFSVRDGKLYLNSYNEDYIFTKLTSKSFHCYNTYKGERVDIDGTKSSE